MDLEILRTVFERTCAIGVLDPSFEWGPQPPKDWNGTPFPVTVWASGFLIAPNMVCTANHVMSKLLGEKKASLRNIVAIFVHPRIGTETSLIYRRFSGYLSFASSPTDPFAIDKRADYALCVMDGPLLDPLKAAPCESIYVTQPVASVGYFMGHSILTEGTLVRDRFGPLVLEGKVAAISPVGLTGYRQASEYLLDMTAAGGLSGAPVVQRETGLVIGMIRAGAERYLPIEGTVPMNIPFALPVTPHFAAEFQNFSLEEPTKRGEGEVRRLR